ncbi:hypothetical protein RYX36_006302, partial [Vicia faba]
MIIHKLLNSKQSIVTYIICLIILCSQFPDLVFCNLFFYFPLTQNFKGNQDRTGTQSFSLNSYSQGSFDDRAFSFTMDVKSIVEWSLLLKKLLQYGWNNNEGFLTIPNNDGSAKGKAILCLEDNNIVNTSQASLTIPNEDECTKAKAIIHNEEYNAMNKDKQ